MPDTDLKLSHKDTSDDQVVAWKTWLVTSVAAILTGFAAYYFICAETWGGTLMDMLQGKESFFGGDKKITGVWAVLIPAGFMACTMMLIVVVQRKWFAGTEGTGIPQAMAALKIGERPERSVMLSVRISIGKILLLSAALFSGITVGREGPSVHVGACFMYLCTKFCKLPTFLVERGLILAGSAAGIAAAFNTPIAGIIFCFEEVGHLFDKKSVVCIIRTTALACGVCVFFMGNYYFYGNENRESLIPLGYKTADGTFLEDFRQWLAVPIIAIFAGFLGGWFGRGVVWASRITSPYLVNHPWRTGAVLGLGLAVVAVCSFGESYGGGYAQAKQMLLEAHETGAANASWYYPLAKAGASFISLISAIPGGLFDPSLATGAGLGQIFYPLFNNQIAPGIGLPEVMMIFMCAYFTGVVQSPITVFTIMFEMTDAYGMILPLMITALLAAWIANMICKPSIYDALSNQFLEAKGLSKFAPKEEE